MPTAFTAALSDARVPCWPVCVAQFAARRFKEIWAPREASLRALECNLDGALWRIDRLERAVADAIAECADATACLGIKIDAEALKALFHSRLWGGAMDATGMRRHLAELRGDVDGLEADMQLASLATAIEVA